MADLAAAGVAVYPTGSTTAVVEVDTAGPLALSQDQAASAALGVWAHAGLSGSDIDELAVMPPLTDGAQPIPAGLFIAGWSQVAPSRAAQLAKKILGDQDWSHYQQAIFPAAVLALFASDMAAMGGTGSATAGRSGTTARNGAYPTNTVLGEQNRSRYQQSAFPAGVPAESAAEVAAVRGVQGVVGAVGAADSVCEQFKGFIFGTIEKVFAAIGRFEVKGFTGNVLKDIFIFIRDVGAVVGNLALDAVKFVVVNGVEVALGPVLNGIAAVASIAAVVSNIVLILQPWTADARPEPLISRRDASAHLGTVTLTMRGITGTNDWPAELAGCARAAGVSLPSLKPRDADLTWTITNQHPAPMIVKKSDAALLKDDGTATMQFETLPETPEVAMGEEQTDGIALLDIAVHRKDLDQVHKLITEEIFTFLPAVVDRTFGGAIRDILSPQIQKLLQPLATLRDMTVKTVIPVNYHTKDNDTSTGPDAGNSATARPVLLPDQCPSDGAVSAAVGLSVAFSPPPLRTPDGDTLCGYDAGASWGVIIGFGALNGRNLDDLAQLRINGEWTKIDIPGTDTAHHATSADGDRVEVAAGGRWFGLATPPGVDSVAAIKRLLGVS